MLGQSGACAQPSDRESDHQAHQGQEEQFLEGKVENMNKCLSDCCGCRALLVNPSGIHSLMGGKLLTFPESQNLHL